MGSVSVYLIRQLQTMFSGEDKKTFQLLSAYRSAKVDVEKLGVRKELRGIEDYLKPSVKLFNDLLDPTEQMTPLFIKSRVSEIMNTISDAVEAHASSFSTGINSSRLKPLNE